MVNICFTFDYELFFGKNYGTPQEVLFEPTYRLVENLTELNVSATFFADVCSVLQAQKYNLTDYIQGFENQLLWMNNVGQDIQLHIHPHWLKSIYKEGEWIFDRNYYRIHSFGFERQKNISGYSIIKNGRKYLIDLLGKQDGSYECIAYRAGGFCLQPSNELIKALYDIGIRIDSSIAPRLVSTSKTNFYNFKESICGSNWWIGYDTPWNIDACNSKKKIFEVPIGTHNKNIVYFALKRLFDRNSVKLPLKIMRGTYIDNSQKNKKGIISIWNYLRGYNAFSMDSYAADYLYRQIKQYYRKYKCGDKEIMEDAPVICLIGHPKLVTTEYISNLKNLINLIKNDNSMNIVNIIKIYRYKNIV